ncbi:MAG: YhfC family intramembrane metalloprotease [Armatimonadetes bacterium]|nr:YhfC family intramembrane metalloprotease [Armatimonadota bacterium]
MQIRWEIGFGFLAAGALTVVSVIVFAVLIAQKTRASWRYWLYGAIVFVVFQGVLRLPWMIALNFLLRDALRSSFAFLVAFTAFAALTAALFERGGQWLLFRRFIKPEEQTAPNALMVGAGHGGVEAFFIGLLIALQGINYIALFMLPSEMLKGQEQAIAQAKAVFAQMAWWMPFMGMWERLSTQVFQIAATIMVWNAFRAGQKWFWLAIAAHFGADFFMPLLHIQAQKSLGLNIGSLVTEIAISIYAATWAYIIWKFVWLPEKLKLARGESEGNEHTSENP